MNERDIARGLKGLAGPARPAAARSRMLAGTLGDTASARGALDVAVWTEPSPVGDLLVAVTPRGLVRIAFAHESRDDVLDELAHEVSPRILESAHATDAVRRELEEYFARERTVFGVPIDRRLIRGLAREVLTETARIPFGVTRSYGDIARRIGRPRAARAVGNALGTNPIPIVVPCHRVIRVGGDVGGYGGHPERKVALLALEGAEVRPL